MKLPTHHEHHGDPCFVCFLLTVHHVVVSTIRQQCLYDDKAEEAYALCCIELFTGWVACRGRIDKPHAWAKTVAKRTCCRLKARLKRTSTVSFNEWVHSPQDPSDGFNADEFRADVERAVACLPPRHAQIFQMKHDQGLTFSEIGRRLGLHKTTASRNYKASLELLAEELADWRED
ncbi:MAG: sigma-70 family RNA polymerase sigma factor [Planctomycetota bacterium]